MTQELVLAAHLALAADMLYLLLTCFTCCSHALLAADMLYWLLAARVFETR
jgi:hypothetical protein